MLWLLCVDDNLPFPAVQRTHPSGRTQYPTTDTLSAFSSATSQYLRYQSYHQTFQVKVPSWPFLLCWCHSMSLSYTHSILIAAIYQRPCDDLHHHRVILPTRVVTKHPTPRCHPPSWCQFSKTYHWQHLIVRIRFFNLFWQRSEIYALFSFTTHCQMFQKVESVLPAKIWRLVGCTEMLSW